MVVPEIFKKAVNMFFSKEKSNNDGNTLESASKNIEISENDASVQDFLDNINLLENKVYPVNFYTKANEHELKKLSNIIPEACEDTHDPADERTLSSNLVNIQRALGIMQQRYNNNSKQSKSDYIDRIFDNDDAYQDGHQTTPKAFRDLPNAPSKNKPKR